MKEKALAGIGLTLMVSGIVLHRTLSEFPIWAMAAMHATGVTCIGTATYRHLKNKKK
ncbi:hypothetical protein KG089_00725 [Carnobacteriaceae bacterium zg-ZUI252]|nr:hypothetical protein [Carnobacteriaceae bacterium zg-ZUI252]MBS4770850.1 hypothetical protein [Carnobacteriaceae bacterium zg-ZUI240]QTU82523.1 hypothetical protein J7S27_04205 [Carnobacteriaceae bacterium zg-C25]